MEEQTRSLTRIFQQKMKEADAAAQAMKGAQAKEHRKELRALQEACDVHLADAAQKIKEANLANKDAIAIAAKNKKLEAANVKLKASETELKAEAKKREAAYAKQDAQLAELRMSSLGSSIGGGVTTVVQTKEAKVVKVEGDGGTSKEAAAAELEAQATKLQAAFDAKLESVRGKLQGQLDSTKAQLEQVRSELTTTTKELKATTLELAELKEESAHALSH